MITSRGTATLLTMLLLGTACRREREPGAAPVVQTITAETREGLDGVLSDYEVIHRALAADRLDGVAVAAKRLGTAASALSPRVPPTLHEPLAGLARAAEQVAIAPTIADARRAFGDLSRHAIALVAAAPQLGEGRRAFECTMASGYQKWIQSGPGIANPYFGSEMLTCGSGSDWK